MKIILVIAITLFCTSIYGQRYSDLVKQKMTLSKWNEESKTNIRLLPKYGYANKNDNQKKSDQEFIDEALKQHQSNRKASEHLIQLGFSYLYRDLKTAMYRFNQAFLLDSTNSDIYWGFASVYMVLEDLVNAKIQFDEGLSISPQNTHLLTDYGTYFFTKFVYLQSLSEKDALQNLESALSYLHKSYQIDPKDQNTTFKLSVCYLSKKDCPNAIRFFNECKKLGGQPITTDYTTTLSQECNLEE